MDPESDSDWDSISGDAVPAPSSPEPTPRFEPPSLANSPKTSITMRDNKHASKPSTINPALERTSASNSPRVSKEKSVLSPSSHKPSQLYGKPGVTSFTDRNLEQRPFRETSPEHNNANKTQRMSRGSRVSKGEEIAVELNEMQYQPSDPPYTDFQGQELFLMSVMSFVLILR